MLPTLIYRCNTIPVKIPAAIFIEFDKLILKLPWKCEGHGKGKSFFLKVKNLLDFKTLQSY